MRSTLLVLFALVSTEALAQAVVNAQAQTAPLTTGPTSGRDVGLFLSPDGGALVLVTNQLAGVGLSTYQLSGAIKQSASTGPTISLDVRNGVTAFNDTLNLVLLGKQAGGVQAFFVNDDGNQATLAPITGDLGAAPQALALWRTLSGSLHVIASGGNKTLDDFTLEESPVTGLTLTLQRSFTLSAEPRFVRVDDARSLALVTTAGGTLLQLDLSETMPVALEVSVPMPASPDLGGVASFPSADGGLLAVISQPGGNRYWVYDLISAAFLGSFQIRGLNGNGLVSGGLGVSVTAQPLPNFPKGVLVVQDPANITGPNAKLVSLVDLGAALGFDVATAQDAGVGAGPDGGPSDAGAGPDGGPIIGPIGGCPVAVDAGALDGGDGGADADGGATDAGPCVVVAPDGGPRDGGSFMRPPDTGVVVDPDPAKPCGCSEAGLLFPAALGALLWALRRRR